VKVATTIASPQGVYSLKYKKLDDLPEGARVAIANDPSNGARGLMIPAPSRGDQVEGSQQRRVDDCRYHR
jgi:hypothetical protein